MALSITAKDVIELASGIWSLEMPPHQVRFFGDCRRTEGARSVLLLTDAKYDRKSQLLEFEAEKAIPLNIGTTNNTLVVGSADFHVGKSKISTSPVNQSDRGSGDREFLKLASELPTSGFEAARLLLDTIRSKFPGDLKRGLRWNFSNTPDNFWYVIVQPRFGGLSITVRGEPERFGKSELELKGDRPGYTRFKVSKIDDVNEAMNIILASKRRD